MIREGTTADPVAGQIENKGNYTDWKVSGYFFSSKDNFVTTSVVDIGECKIWRYFASILNEEDVGRDGRNSLSMSLYRGISTTKISEKEEILHSPAS